MGRVTKQRVVDLENLHWDQSTHVGDASKLSEWTLVAEKLMITDILQEILILVKACVWTHTLCFFFFCSSSCFCCNRLEVVGVRVALHITALF